MLTSSANQYLRPEYLTPLPTTLDAKKSPLALLAQTCSQIGVDPPTSKSSLLTPLDKSGKSSKSSESSGREKSSPAALSNPASSASSTFSPASSESTKLSSFKPYESCVTRDKASSPEQQRVPSVHSSSGGNSRSRTPGNGKRCSSNQSASSSSGRAITPQAGRKSSTPSNDSAPRESPGARLAASDPSAANSPSLQPAGAKPAYSPAQGGFSSQELSPGGFRPATMSVASNSASSGATTITTPSAAAYGLPYPPQLSGLDPLMASSLMSQHQAALKSGLAAHPYLSYARVKTPTGADALVPVCRDPYCSGCQLNSQLLAATSTASAKAPGGACPAGCVQCDHKSQAAVSPYAAYAHAQLVALAAASQMPYVCNWIAGDAGYCGKRFSSSDELLQHFRGHTGGQLSPADQSAAAAAATTAAALSLAGLGAGHPLFSRSYPTPPLSPLAAARYHPYNKPYGGPPLSSLGLPLPPPPHPAAAGLPPYFSPYSLYAGSRLGAASGMHP